ncbi:hypothetical protein Ntsu_68930 [Nocardia sp. IFM 10818]
MDPHPPPRRSTRENRYPHRRDRRYGLDNLTTRREEYPIARRRYVARGVPGGYRVWDNKVRRWWGDLYELCPDDLVAELNGAHRPDRITELTKRARARKR